MNILVKRCGALALAAGALAALTACDDDGGSDGNTPGAIPVEATDNACKVEPATAPVGSITFHVTNKGSKTNEFYLYGPDGKILSEVEGIGAGTSREMTLQVTQPGKYTTACKPGMKGSGIRGEFTVTPK